MRRGEKRGKESGEKGEVERAGKNCLRGGEDRSEMWKEKGKKGMMGGRKRKRGGGIWEKNKRTDA